MMFLLPQFVKSGWDVFGFSINRLLPALAISVVGTVVALYVEHTAVETAIARMMINCAMAGIGLVAGSIQCDYSTLLHRSDMTYIAFTSLYFVGFFSAVFVACTDGSAAAAFVGLSIAYLFVDALIRKAFPAAVQYSDED